MSNKKKYLYRTGIIILGVVFLACLLFWAVKQFGKQSLIKPLTDGEDAYQKILYQEKEYQYRKDLINILCMGVDKYEEMAVRNDRDNSVGQSDAIALLSLDLKKKEIRVIAVPRDTMVTLEMYDGNGKYLGTGEGQITLQYAWGDGQELSATLMAQQVSGILNGIPIHAYLAVNIHSLWDLNDAIGGVDITMDEDYTMYNSAFKKGETVHLEGEVLSKYLRGRDSYGSGGAYARIHRMKQYMLAFFEQAKVVVKKDMTLPIRVLEELKDDIETDVTADEAVYLVTEAIECSFLSENMHTLPGELKRPQKYEEFHLDERKLNELIVNLFYEEIEKGNN